jgi:hypothetical protein
MTHRQLRVAIAVTLLLITAIWFGFQELPLYDPETKIITEHYIDNLGVHTCFIDENDCDCLTCHDMNINGSEEDMGHKEDISKAIDELKREAFSQEKDPEQRCFILQDLSLMVRASTPLTSNNYKSVYFRTGKALKP